MLYTLFIIPILIILIGYLMYKYPPKKINWFIGYRTNESRKNEENWEFANRCCGKLWIITGLIMFVVTLIMFAIFYLNVISWTENMITVLVLIQLAIIMLPILIVENKLKERINK